MKYRDIKAGKLPDIIYTGNNMKYRAFKAGKLPDVINHR